MRRKATRAFVALLAVLTLVCMLVACNDNKNDKSDPEKPTTIVYIGDSIAEALIGPSPVSERDNYGYYALVGRANEYVYYNHSVSGHKTSGGMLGGNGGGLLEMIDREDENGALMKTHLEEADIIHISVLGNNILQYNLGLLLLEVADPDFDKDFKEGEGNTLLDYLYSGSHEYEEDEYGVYDLGLKPGCVRQSVEYPGQTVTFDFPNTYQNLCDIIARLKELNPDATILFETVYNPFYENCVHLHEPVKQVLATMKDENGDFITTTAQYRKLADKLLDVLNHMIDKYLGEHPGDFVKLDVKKAFEDITNEDVDENGVVDLSEDSLGRSLIFEDCTHPSNFGHAIIASVTQKALEELHLANKNATANYKKIKIEQINRMFKDVPGFDAEEAVANINAATDFTSVSKAYFKAIKDFTPINYQHGTTTGDNAQPAFKSTMKFDLDEDNLNFMGQSSFLVSMVMAIALDAENTYFEFTPDGKMHGQITTKNLSELLEGISGILPDFNISSMLSGVDLTDGLKSYAEPMFPGFTERIKQGDLKGALELVTGSLGFGIKGIDYNDAKVKAMLEKMGDDFVATGKLMLPSDLFDNLPENTALTLTMDWEYSVQHVKGSDGKEYTAIYIGGDVAHNVEYTQPFAIFTMGENEEGVTTMNLRVEFMNIDLALKQRQAA